MSKLINTDSQSIVEIKLNTPDGSILIDPDSIPAFTVKRTNGTTKYAYTSTTVPAVTKLAVGRYAITWRSDEAAEFELVWDYAVGAVAYETTEDIIVYDVGAGPMLGAQSDGDITAYIARYLGEGVVGVELTADMLSDSVIVAKQWFSSLIGQLQFAEITVPPSGGEVARVAVAADCMSVVEVSFDVSTSGLFDQFDWAGVQLGPLSFGMSGNFGGGGYSSLVQSMQYREQAKSILATNRDWTWDYGKGALLLYPTGGSSIGTKAAVWYLSNKVDLEKLQTYEYLLLKKYALAESMQVLANIRMKYSEMPSATGTISMNGSDLMTNGEALKADLQEQAKALRAPAAFFAG